MTVSSLSNGEVLLRRFDPTDSGSVVVDEADGGLCITGGAMRWSSYGADDQCCSTSRERILAEHGHSKWAACEPPYTALAATSRAVIEAFDHSLPDGTKVRPFSAAADPVEDPPTPLNLSHAVVHTRQADAALGSKQLGKAKRALARKAFTIIPAQ